MVRIIFFPTGEGHPNPIKLTYGELRLEVGAWAKALRNAGVGKNSVVAGVLPNSPEVSTPFLVSYLLFYHLI